MASTDISVATTRKRATAKAPPVPPALTDTAALIEAITKASRDPTVDIGKMQFLLDTRRKLLDEEAEQEFRAHMALAQAEMEPIAKDLENPQTRSRYSSLAALDAAIRPIYTKYSFAVTFDTEPWPEPDSILVVCYVERGRHSRRHQVPMPCDTKGPRGNDVMTRTHATGSAVSYGRRYTLCMGFNLVTADDDGNRAGLRPSPAQYARAVDEAVPPAANERAPHTRKAMDGIKKPSLAETQLEASVALITKKELAELYKLMGEAGKSEEREQIIKDYYEIPILDMLTHAQYEIASNQLTALIQGMKKNAKRT
jgi:ERF superfamily